MNTNTQQTYNGKPVLTEDTFDYATAQPGDCVEQAVADNARNAMPPACMTEYCIQMGEPYSHREDPDTGKWWPSGPDAIWQYCGHCFQGETVERGKAPVYC